MAEYATTIPMRAGNGHRRLGGAASSGARDVRAEPATSAAEQREPQDEFTDISANAHRGHAASG